MKYRVEVTKQFKKDYKKLSELDASETDAIIRRLENGERLADNNRDHKLKGDYKGCNDCHIRADLILVYKRFEEKLLLLCMRVGNHASIF